MKKRILILLFVSVSILFSCHMVQERNGKYKIQQITGFLWKAKSETATVYMLGSVHLANKEMYPLPSAFEESFDSSEVLVVEIDLNQPMAEQLKKLSKYPIKTRLSLNGTLIVARDAAHAKIKEIIDSLKVPQGPDATTVQYGNDNRRVRLVYKDR